MNKEKSLLNAKNIHKAFYYPSKVPILKGLNLTIPEQTSVAITGRSGEGKSTLLQILGTLDSPCEGSLEIAQQEVSLWNKSRIRNREIAFVFQSFHLLEDYTALENVLMPARIGRKRINKGSQAYERACDLLSLVGLQERLHFRSKLLSGGEKQRVAVARALCNDPSIIFADEPSGNLDHESSAAIHTLLLNFAKQEGKALVVVTHDLELASICDCHYVLEDGVLLNHSPRSH